MTWEWDSHGNGNPMGMGNDDKLGNGNGKEWKTTCVGMGMALIPTGINSYRRLVLMTILFCIANNSYRVFYTIQQRPANFQH